MILSHRTCYVMLSATHVVLAVLTLFGESAVVEAAAVELLIGAIYLLISHVGHSDHPSARPPGQ